MLAVYWLIGFIFLNTIIAFSNRKIPIRRLRICAHGCKILITFLITCSISILVLLGMIPILFDGHLKDWILTLLFVIITENIIFWLGIIEVYLTSAQIGLKWRVIGILCGFIPVINVIALLKIIHIAKAEYQFEFARVTKNNQRKENELCKTQYPLLLVHGVFFRDFKYFNYWGRIPKDLEANGATIFYGNHQSAASVADSARKLAERISEIRKETGCEKVNVIAHSKGGLDTRYAISKLGMDQYIASLTTINTPHRGCEFADYLLHVIPNSIKEKVANTYNATLKKIGDENPDFIAAVTDLTADACRRFNEETLDVETVYYQSVGSKLNKASGGRFPLNFSHYLVKYFEGANDGLVAESSFPWGEKYTFLTTNEKRGISHGDMIDLNRENIKDFDVREYYVNLVNDLKEKGF